MITKEQVADVLDAAADLYQSEQYEWCRGAYFRGDLQVGISMCASQALRTACGEELYEANEGTRAVRSDTYRLDRRLLGAAFEALNLNDGADRSPEGFLIKWNDSDQRTKQEVIDLFKNTAKELRK